MLLISFRARLLTCLVAALLLIPVAGLRLQDEARLVRFHNRTLHAAPPAAQFLRDPVAFFREGKRWLADRAYPIVQASMLQKKIRFHLLHTPPQRRITLGRDGFVFVNGQGEDSVNGLLRNTCIDAHSDALAARLSESLPAIARFARGRGLQVDIVVMPTSMTLYADRLPDSVPARYRDACLLRFHGQSPLSRITPPPGVSFLFAFQPMKAASGDEAFFPKGNWHASGMSLKVVRDAYLSARRVGRSVDDRLEHGVAPSEILGAYGIVWNVPMYAVRNPNVQADTRRNALFHATIRDRFASGRPTTHAYVNAAPVLDESVLMLSDSYGELASAVFAGAFRDVVQVTVTDLDQPQVAEVVDRTAAAFGIDRLILLVQEGGVHSLVEWSYAFAAANRSASP